MCVVPNYIIAGQCCRFVKSDCMYNNWLLCRALLWSRWHSMSKFCPWLVLFAQVSCCYKTIVIRSRGVLDTLPVFVYMIACLHVMQWWIKKISDGPSQACTTINIPSWSLSSEQIIIAEPQAKVAYYSRISPLHTYTLRTAEDNIIIISN